MNGKAMHEARAALATHPRCGAHCRTTGLPCRNPAMENGRCRMHGGRSTGRPIIHGVYAYVAQVRRREWRGVLLRLKGLIERAEN